MPHLARPVPGPGTMADPDTLIKAKIHYYCREKQFHSMQYAAVEGMKRFRWDRDIISGHV